MIGGLAGLGLLISYLSASWQRDTSSSSLFGSDYGVALITLAIFTVIGIFIFPRTIGMAFTPMSWATPLAFLISLVRNGFSYSLFIAFIGISAWLVTFIVGNLRPDST